MHSLRILDELPSGYFVEESPRGILALHSSVARPLHEAGYGPERDGELARSELSGRRPLFELSTPDETFLVRRFSHGGLMRWLTGVRFLDPERPFRELILSDSLRRAGILSPQVVAARARMARGGGYYLDLVTRRVQDSLDLGYVLGMVRRGELADAVRRKLLHALGRFVARMHLHGCLHADLTPSNFLVSSAVLEGEEPELWVLDLDGSVLLDHVPDVRRRQNLRRLYRFVDSRDRRLGATLSRSDYCRFLSGYHPEDGRWKEDWRAVVTGHSRWSLLHVTGGFFERCFGRSRDPREAAL